MRSSVRRVDVLDAGLFSANSRKTGARRPCATVVCLKTEANRRPGELGPLDVQRRLMDKLDFLSSLKSTRREFRAMILNFSIDEPYASALARNAQGMLTASIGSEMERLQVVALIGRPRQ